MRKGLWVWGFVLETIPSIAPDVNGKTYCSLETGADYLGVENLVYMNSMFDISAIDDKYFGYIKQYKNIICALTKGHFLESAKKISGFSLKHKNIKGVIIDDFLTGSMNAGSEFKPEDLKIIYEGLKSENPDLKLYVVRYTWQDQHDLIPYLDYIDGINLWVWISSEHFWRAEYAYELVKIKALTGKPIIQGLFIHNYGETWSTSEEPVSMELTQLQFKNALDFFRAGGVDGCIILQSGWFCRENHREQMQWIKNYIDWFYGTTTWRDNKPQV